MDIGEEGEPIMVPEPAVPDYVPDDLPSSPPVEPSVVPSEPQPAT